MESHWYEAVTILPQYYYGSSPYSHSLASMDLQRKTEVNTVACGACCPNGHLWSRYFGKQNPKIKVLISSLNLQKKPYSAVTVAVERLTSEQFEEDDLSGIPDLVEAIKLQASGPQEAARAIRKKLKYGNVHRQIRALVILDGLIQNAGARFQRTFADEMLLERLRVCGTSDLSDPLVREKCKELFRSWAAEYKNIRGLEQICALYKVIKPHKAFVAHLPNIFHRNFLAASRLLHRTSQKCFGKRNKIHSLILMKKQNKKPKKLKPIPVKSLHLHP